MVIYHAYPKLVQKLLVQPSNIIIIMTSNNLKSHSIFHNAYNQALETTKLEYRESLRYYAAARSELNAISEYDDGSVTTNLRNEVHTQFAHTYLRLGMLLDREDSTAEVYENGCFEDTFVSCTNAHDRKVRKELKRHELSANEAIRKALSVYESLGELRKQEAAYAYFQLACYQRNCCYKFMDSGNKKGVLFKGENRIQQRVKQYASLAERNWQKAIDFYGAKTHPSMFLTILIERSALLLSVSSHLHSYAVFFWTLTKFFPSVYYLHSNYKFAEMILLVSCVYRFI